jgi:hypothetical protein
MTAVTFGLASQVKTILSFGLLALFPLVVLAGMKNYKNQIPCDIIKKPLPDKLHSERDDLSISKRTTCVSCQNQLPSDMRWMGTSSKCFDCERELVAQSGNQAGYYASKSFT